MRARVIRVYVALTAHDERTRTHAARNDAELTGARRHRTLARDPHLLAEVFLERAVVVVAVDCVLALVPISRPNSSRNDFSTACSIRLRLCAA